MSWKVVWKYAETMTGSLFAQLDGAVMMQELCVDNLDSQHQVLALEFPASRLLSMYG